MVHFAAQNTHRDADKPALVFPFTLHAEEWAAYTESPRNFREAFLAAKPEGLIWYAYDVTVQSSTLVDFTVYGMRDTVSGGVGKKVGAFSAAVSAEVTRPAIVREATRLAAARRDDEVQQREDEIIAGYVAEILATTEPQAGLSGDEGEAGVNQIPPRDGEKA